MFSLSFVLGRARDFLRHSLHILGSLLDDFLNVSPMTVHTESSYFADDPCQRSNPYSQLSSLPWQTAGLATAGSFLLNLLNRLPLTGILLLASVVVGGLVVTALDESTWQILREKLTP
jgi:hypothetical protein